MAVYRDTTSEFRNEIIRKLELRNQKESKAFAGLIQAYNRIGESNDACKAQNVQLTLDVERLRQENLELSIKGGGPGGGEKVQHLEQKLYKLQEELTELHRKKGDNSQQIIDLKNLLQEKEKEIQLKVARLADSESNCIAMRGECKALESTILELEGTNQMLKDEQQALHLAFTSLEEKFRKMNEENAELVARWMEQKASAADRLNEENDVMFRKRQQKLQKELAEAAKEPVPIFLPHDPNIPCMVVSIPDKATHNLDAHDGEVNDVCWTPSGHLLGSGGSDRKLKLWELSNGQLMSKGALAGSNAAVTSVEFDSEEKLVLGASNDFATRVWTISDQRLRHTLTGHSGKVLAARFIDGHARVVTGSHDRTLKIWDLNSKACVKTIFAGSACNDIGIYDVSGTTILSGHFDKKVRFWDSRSESSTTEISLQGRVTSLDLSFDKYSLLCCCRDDTLKLVDIRKNTVIKTFCTDGFRVYSDWTRARFSPDGQYVVCGSNDGSVFIWNSEGKLEKVLKEHNHPILSCSWHPSGKQLVTSDRQKKIVVWSDF